MYADYDYYKNTYKSNVLTIENADRYLKKASSYIDTLTYCRINKTGFDGLTQFQKRIVQEVCCEIADFIFENEDLLTSAISGYSLNGVSIRFDNVVTMKCVNDVILPSSAYAYLCQTGLCTGVIR